MQQSAHQSAQRAAAGAISGRSLLAAVLAASLTAQPVLAAEEGSRRADRQSAPQTAASEAGTPPGRSSMFAVKRDPSRPRSVFWIPLVSFLLPGFDQWWEGQTGSAAAYTGAALAGAVYAESVRTADHLDLGTQQKDQDQNGEQKDDDEDTLDSKDVALRKYTLGTLIYQGAGGLSAYHSFRTAVRTHAADGKYAFLRHEETPADIYAAPFHFEYLARPTTYIPLAIGAALAGLVVSAEPPEGYEKDSLTSADWFFTGAFSYNAGTHEEAMFRGWIMPVLAGEWMTPFWANASQATLFALAHLGSNPRPIPQLLLGYHLGYVTQRRDWRLSESIFIHVWWDVLAFASAFSYRKKQSEEAQSLIPPPVLWLPPLVWQF